MGEADRSYTDGTLAGVRGFGKKMEENVRAHMLSYASTAARRWSKRCRPASAAIR